MDQDLLRLECVKMALVGRESYPVQTIIEHADKLFQYITTGTACCGAATTLPNRIKLTTK
jgi:hypothetical protein